jgi:hypothetical protein
MSRFFKIYPGTCPLDCTIGITELKTDADEDAEFDVEVQFIRFECFLIRAIGNNGPRTPFDVIWYLASGHRHSLRHIFWGGGIDADEETTDLELAQPFLTGYIDDNGTSEIRFETQPLFLQNRRDAASLGNLLDRLYDIAKELLWNFRERQEESRPEARGVDDVSEES